MIYVDWLRPCKKNLNWRYDKSCHLMSGESIEELHNFASKIGLKLSWLQNKKIPHYDLNERMREKAVKNGAIECDRETFLQICRYWNYKKLN